MAKSWGSILATHHARADQRFRNEAFSTKNFPKQVSKLVEGKQDEFASDILQWSAFYADVVQKDYVEFKSTNNVDDDLSSRNRKNGEVELAAHGNHLIATFALFNFIILSISLF